MITADCSAGDLRPEPLPRHNNSHRRARSQIWELMFLDAVFVMFVAFFCLGSLRFFRGPDRIVPVWTVFPLTNA